MNNIKSLEQWVYLLLVSINILVLLLTTFCLWLVSESTLIILTLLAFQLPLQFFLSEKIQAKLISPYYGLLTLVDGIKVDDYSLQVKPAFEQGISATLLAEITSLSESLRQKKHLFDEKNLLVHSLIQQLDSPVLLLDHEHKLIQGNQALSSWLGKDWRLVRLMPVTSFNLVQGKNTWAFNDKALSKQYKIRSSRFTDGAGEHQLLILTDISLDLRKMHQDSWQQVVRVLSHEIKNSLTPIKSLAQTMSQFSDNEEQKMALDTIVERSQNLQLFVSQYSRLSKKHSVNLKEIDLITFFKRIQSLYKDIQFNFDFNTAQISADPVLFEQVIINLVDNAKQASQQKAEITISSQLTNNNTLIKIIDKGCGIQNEDNLFVPFYTTKSDGQGIGLVLSRNIIEQHGGKLTLENTKNIAGVTAKIRLPNRL